MSILDIVLLALTLVSPVLHGLGLAAHPVARVALAILPDVVGALRKNPAPVPAEKHPEIPPPPPGGAQ